MAKDCTKYPSWFQSAKKAGFPCINFPPKINDLVFANDLETHVPHIHPTGCMEFESSLDFGERKRIQEE